MKKIFASPEVLAGLSQDIVLKVTEKLTQSSASIFDKALDSTYLRTHIGGGNHRLFDGGHSLPGAFKSVFKDVPDASFLQKFEGTIQALWKDLCTVKGLPFVTVDKGFFEDISSKLSKIGIPKSWSYDLLSYDAMEVLTSTLVAGAAIFALKENDIAHLSELLGSSSVIALLSANLMMGITAVLIFVGAFAMKHNRISKKDLLKGGLIALVSTSIFILLDMPFIMHLVTVLLCASIIRKVVDNKSNKGVPL